MRLDGTTGLARAEAAARFARAVRTSRAGWDACPPRVRMAALVDAVNAELAHVSASPAVALLHELPPFTTPRRAWFLRGAWCVLFDPHALGGGLGYLTSRYWWDAHGGSPDFIPFGDGSTGNVADLFIAIGRGTMLGGTVAWRGWTIATLA